MAYQRKLWLGILAIGVATAAMQLMGHAFAAGFRYLLRAWLVWVCLAGAGRRRRKSNSRSATKTIKAPGQCPGVFVRWDVCSPRNSPTMGQERTSASLPRSSPPASARWVCLVGGGSGS